MTFANPDVRQTIGGVLFVNCDESFTDPVNAAQNTTVFDGRAFGRKLFYINNATNQTVVFTIQSSPAIAFTDARTVGTTISLATNTKTEVHVSDYHAWMRVNIDPAADSTGTVTINLRAQGA